MRLPHNASSLSREQWTFALKSSCPDSTGMHEVEISEVNVDIIQLAGNPEWKNATLSEIQNGQSGVVDENFVSVLISHF